MSDINRRALITGLISFVAAPAIVRAGSLMPVRQMLPDPFVKCTFFQERIFWISGDQTVSYTPPIPPGMQALLQERVNAAFGTLRRSLIENLDRQLYNNAEPKPLLGTFE